MEARLFEEGTIPAFTTREFFAGHPWIWPGHQLGHQQRTDMVSGVVHRLYRDRPFGSVSDLGCGDGSLLAALADLPVPAWGYDAGVGNVAVAAETDLDVRLADFLTDPLDYGELVIASEVIEHLVDPHGFVRDLPGDLLVLSSPSAETATWHYEHHAWAWDMDGYREMAEGAGWTVIQHEDCEAEVNHHNGETRPQRFQAIACVRST